MFSGLTSYEQSLMRGDFEANLLSADATTVTLEWEQDLSSGAFTMEDTTFWENNVPRGVYKETLTVPCLEQTVTQKDHKLLAYGIVGVGDRIFWFSDSIDFNEPVADKKLMLGSLIIITQDGQRWQPKQHDSREAGTNLVARFGSIQVGQPIPCVPFGGAS